MTDYSEIITTLNRKRGNIKGQLTRMSTKVEDESDISEIQAQLDVVAKIRDKFEVLKEAYYKSVTEDDIEEIEVTLLQVDEQIDSVKVSLKASINKNKIAYHSNEPVKSISVRRPKMPLPVFNGKFEEWYLFKSQFNSLINENSELPDNDNLHYLQGLLSGDAKIIEAPDDNYSSLFKALEQRYDNKRIIVDCHIKGILNLQSLRHESARDLRSFLDTIKKNLRSLKGLDIERDKFSNVLLLNIVLEKLNRETRKQYELTLKNNDVPNFDSFLEFLERLCQILSSIHANVLAKHNSERPRSFFVISNKAPQMCVACKNNAHALYNCDEFKQIKLEERLNLVKKL